MRSTGYVVVELNTGKFQPEYAGKLNFYVVLAERRFGRNSLGPATSLMAVIRRLQAVADVTHLQQPGHRGEIGPG